MFNSPYLQNFNQMQPMYSQPNVNTPQDERIFVSNQQSAESFLLAPSGFIRLWDSSQPRFYERRADATGRPLPMDIYEYKRVTPLNSTEIEESNKISFDQLKSEIETINERIDKLEQKKGVVKNVKQSADDTTA